MTNEQISLAELKNKAMSFDRAEVRDVHVIKEQDDYLCKDVMGVWNIDKNMLACLGPKNYAVIQHKHAVESLIDAITSLNIKANCELSTSAHGIFIDFDFYESKVELKEVGENFTSGIRLVSDYSNVAGLQIAPRLTRLVCMNGMVISEVVRSRRIKWTEQLNVELQGIIDKMINDIISSDDRLSNMVSICMRDSVEWQTAKLLAKELFKRKKYAKEIMARTLMDSQGRINRWNFYNGITQFITQSKGRLRPVLEAWFQNKAQKVLVTSFPELTEQLVRIEEK